MICKYCNCDYVVRNGFSLTNKQRYKCRGCGRQFVLSPDYELISEEKRALVDKLLLERISQAGIVRAVGVSMSWLSDHIKKNSERSHEKLTRAS